MKPDVITNVNSMAGVRVALTRSAEGNAEWAPGLEAVGAQVIDCPCLLTTTLPESVERLRRALSPCAWIAFSSARAVRALRELAPELDLGSKRLAAVGEATAESARKFGLEVELVSTGGTARHLAEDLIAHSAADERILWLGAREGRRELPDVLAAAGRDVADVALYRTERLAPSNAHEASMADAIFFASPSAVEAFRAAANSSPHAWLVSIGPTTSAAIRDAGWPVHAEARRRDLGGMLEALERALHTDRCTDSLENPSNSNRS